MSTYIDGADGTLLGRWPPLDSVPNAVLSKASSSPRPISATWRSRRTTSTGIRRARANAAPGSAYDYDTGDRHER